MPGNRRGAALLLGVGLLSAALIGLELALANVFAVLMQYHYVSVIISLAIFGIGVGALFSYRWRIADFSMICFLTGLYVSLLALFLVWYPYPNHLIVYALFAGIPFLLFGGALGIVLYELKHRVALVYAADLCGAGIGVLLAIAVMNWRGGMAALLFFACMAALVGVIGLVASDFSIRARRLIIGIASLGMSIVLFLASVVPGWGSMLELDPSRLKGASPDKTMVGVLQSDPRAQIAYTSWDAFARTDVVTTADRSRSMLFVDGGAGSYMYPFNGELSSVAGLMEDIEFLPFAISPIHSAVVVGAGGGRDVLYSLVAGAKQVDAIEVSPGVVDSVREFADYNGHLADRAGIKWHIGEGRHLIESSGSKVDAIVLDLVYSQVGGVRNQALSENFVFTSEAFEQYIRKLNSGGRIIIIAHHGLEGIRAFFTGFQAVMVTSGKKPADAAKHTALLLAPQGSKAPDLTVAVIGKSPLSSDELEVLQAGAMAHGLTELFVPGKSEMLLKPLLDGKMSFDKFVRDSDYNVYPVSDNRPFFFQIDKRFPSAYSQWLVVNILLTILTIAGIKFSGLVRKVIGGAGIGARPLVYFSLLGIGYMCLQVPIIQKSMLMFGSPVLTTAIVLFAMLLGGGAGSWIAGRLRLPSGAVWIAVPAAIIVFIALYSLLPGLIGLAEGARIVVVGAIIFALGVALGMPMPIGLRLGEGKKPGTSALYFAINGIAALWGSWAAASVTFLAGFILALLLGLACYAGVALIGWRTKSL